MSLAETSQVFGQNETLIASIRNILRDYSPKSIFKEYLQNADDAGATRFHVIIDHRSHPTNSLICSEMSAWQGPAILIFNNEIFSQPDFNSLMRIRVGGKQNDDTMIGKHGLGFNSCYHFTDVPSLISGDSIVFLDPQERFLRRDGNFQRGIKCPFPRNGIHQVPERDQLVPFEGIEGIDFRSTFNGTLFRIPLRTVARASEISDATFTPEAIIRLFEDIRSNISSEFLFLRNIEKIEMSYIRAGVPLRIIPLWTATITGLDDEIRSIRRNITNGEIQAFQIDTRLTIVNRHHDDRWIVVTGAQETPAEHQEYANRHRLRVLGGVAASLTSTNFIGRMFSFLSLSDVTHLPVHLSGTWAQGSDRGKLLIENNALPDIDSQRLAWNRHILLDFLPKLYCKLLIKAIELQNIERIINLGRHPISKFWPFPSVTRNCPTYAIEYGFRVLQHVLQNEDIFRLINDDNDANENVDILFNLLPRDKVYELHILLQNNWDEIDVTSNPDLTTLVCSLPIWPTLTNPLIPNPSPPLKAASGGHILPRNFNHYRTRDNKVFFDTRNNDVGWRILKNLGVPLRDIHSYTFEDVEFPTGRCDDNNYYYYLNFLKSILGHYNIVQDLRNKSCFPTFKKRLRRISDLYNHDDDVFRIVFGGLDVFLSPDFSGYINVLSNIGFNNIIDQPKFRRCAEKIEELQREQNPPSDLRYRGFILVDHLYNHINDFELDLIIRISFVPIVKSLGVPYSPRYYDRPHVLDCFRNIILPQYKEIAWSQTSLIAEDAIPPQTILQNNSSLGKPSASIVVNHLRFLHVTLRNDEEWRENWAGIFRRNIDEVYRWFEEECLNENIILSDHIREHENLFLNFNRNEDPFDLGNWVSARDLVLNNEPGEERYINPSLARYPNMLRSVGVREIRRPNFEINVRQHNQSDFVQSRLFENLMDQNHPLHDVTFIVNNERIRTSRFVLSAISEGFRQRFVSGGSYAGSNTINIRNVDEPIRDIRSNSMRILLRYLYGQSIDHAIQNLNGDEDNAVNDRDNLDLYRDLLKLANYYNLDHLKELMEFRLSYLVNMRNVQNMRIYAETSRANQLRNFCERYIETNGRL